MRRHKKGRYVLYVDHVQTCNALKEALKEILECVETDGIFSKDDAAVYQNACEALKQVEREKTEQESQE